MTTSEVNKEVVSTSQEGAGAFGLFHPIEAATAREAIKAQIRSLISKGLLRRGDKLPAERALVKSLDVSRPTLREALRELENENVLRTVQGRGTVVGENVGSGLTDPLLDILKAEPEVALDFLEFRIELEGAAAAFAATRATDSDRAAIGRILAEMDQARAADDFALEVELDSALHMAIVEAAHNMIMLHVARSMHDLMKNDMFFNRRVLHQASETGQKLVQQHLRIGKAVLERRPTDAREAMREHLRFVRDELREHMRYTAREQIANRRLGKLASLGIIA